MKKLSFVIPCYNSEKSIGIVVNEIITTIESKNTYDYEIILVNDSSKDNTFPVIRELCAQNKKIIGLNLSKNFRQPSAMLAGFSVSTGDIIVCSDDDGQTPVDEVYKLLDKLDEGYDVVFAQFDVIRHSIFHGFGTSLNNIMANYLLDKPKHLHMGSFWVCQQFVIKEALKCTNPLPYLAGIFLNITRNMTAVPTSHRNRLAGKSNYTFKKMVSLWLNGFTAFSIKPLRLASVIGFITAFIGFCYITFIIINKIRFPNLPMGYSSIMSALLFIGGVIMMMLGLIGEYVGRIYININNSPQYIIKEKLNI